MHIERITRPSTIKRIDEELVTNILAPEKVEKDEVIKEVTDEKTGEVLKSVEKCQDNALETEEELKKTAEPVVDATASEHKDEVFAKLEENLEEENKVISESVDVKNRKELASLILECKKSGKRFSIKRSLKDGYRYTFTTEITEAMDESTKGDLIDELVTSGKCADRAEAEEYIDNAEEEKPAEEPVDKPVEEGQLLNEGTALDNPYAKEAAKKLIDARATDPDTLGVIVSYKPDGFDSEIKCGKIVHNQEELDKFTAALDLVLDGTGVNISAIYHSPEKYLGECIKEDLEEVSTEEEKVEEEEHKPEEEKEVCPECGEEECVCDEKTEEKVAEEPAVQFTPEEVKEVATDAAEEVIEETKAEVEPETVEEKVEEVVTDAVEEKVAETEETKEEVCPECGKEPCECAVEEVKEEIPEVVPEEDKEEEVDDFDLDDISVSFFESLDNILDEDITVEEPREIKDSYDLDDFEIEDVVDTVSFVPEVEDNFEDEDEKVFNFDIYKTPDDKYVAFGDETPFGPSDDIDTLKDTIRDFMDKSEFDVVEKDSEFVEKPEEEIYTDEDTEDVSDLALPEETEEEADAPMLTVEDDVEVSDDFDVDESDLAL